MGQSYQDLIVVLHLRVADSLLQVLNPVASLVSVSAVVDSDLVHGKYDLEWVNESR